MRIRFGTEVYELVTRNGEINEDLLNRAIEVVLPQNRDAEDFVDWLQQNEFAKELPESIVPSPFKDDEASGECGCGKVHTVNRNLAIPLSVLTNELFEKADELDAEAGYESARAKAPGMQLRRKGTLIANVCTRNGLRHIYNWVQLNPKEAKKLHHVGPKTFDVIKEFLGRYDFGFAMHIPAITLEELKCITSHSPVEDREFHRKDLHAS